MHKEAYVVRFRHLRCYSILAFYSAMCSRTLLQPKRQEGFGPKGFTACKGGPLDRSQEHKPAVAAPDGSTCRRAPPQRFLRSMRRPLPECIQRSSAGGPPLGQWSAGRCPLHRRALFGAATHQHCTPSQEGHNMTWVRLIFGFSAKAGMPVALQEETIPLKR